MIKKLDLKQWLKDHPEAQASKPQAKPSTAINPYHPNRSKDAYSQARAYTSKTAPAIEGQGGSKQTYGLACALVKGFCLSNVEAFSLLNEWNKTCVPPWTEAELEHKILEAEKAQDQYPRGYKIQTNQDFFGNVFDTVSEDGPGEPGTPAREHSGILDDPASIALRFVEEHKTDDDLCEYRWWNGQFHCWNGSHYDIVQKDDMDSIIFWFIEDTFIKKFLEECMEVPTEKIPLIKKKRVTNPLISNVKTGITNIISIPPINHSEPFWLINPSELWAPDEMISASNRLIHLPSFVNNSSTSYIKKHPKYFSTYSLKYSFNYNHYDGPIEPPPIWADFLHSTWPDDQESIDALQEWYGYFLIPCTKMQKIFMLIGQKRSGKGTIIRTAKHMLGEENVCYPTFKSLTNEFGKQALIGKSLAIFPDARITSRTDTGDVVESILAISGEDSQTINRKYLSAVTKQLKCRFLISSNLLPRLTEDSGALVSRAIVLKFDESFIDREDIELESKLMPEIPMILRWAIDGWKRLNERGRFLQPQSGAEIVADFLNLSSPISHWTEDCAIIGPEFTVHSDDAFYSWKNWCENQNRDNVGDKNNFMRSIRATIPNVSFGPPLRDGNPGNRIIKGFKLRYESKVDIFENFNGTANGNGHHEEWKPYKDA